MASSKHIPEVVVEVAYEVTVSRYWLSFCTSSDPFMHSCCGYWAFGVDVDDGWLMFDQASEGTDKEPSGAEIRAAKLAHKQGAPLPTRWYLLDKAAAKRAYAIGCQLWGQNWYDGEHGDLSGYDAVIQRALLGEERYG